MVRAIFVLLAAALVCGGVYFYLNYEVKVDRTEDGLEAIRIVPRRGAAPAGGGQPGVDSDRLQRPLIRIATFNADRLDEHKLANRRVNDVLVHLIPRFDLVAMQDIRAADRGILVRLVEQINTGGRQFDFATHDGAGRGDLEPFSAFLFNRTAVEVDRSTVLLVEDPEDRFRRPPLVGQFRVRGPDPAEAFTFKLVNVHLDPEQLDAELDLLDDVYRAVRDKEPAEDDVILLGDFGEERAEPGLLVSVPDVQAAVADTPTTLSGIRYPVDNLFFHHRATTEFAGRAEVFDVMRAFDLTRREAEEISDHLPVWAEFSSYEGGESGLIGGHSGPADPP
jgi:endonuclease/exonuclease/phosphatase family metal-dependent hydrolase